MNHFKYKDASNSDVGISWKPLGATSPNRENDSEIQAMHQLLSDLTQAVLDFGPNKAQHMKVLVRHRTEWPFLWEKIDSIVKYISADPSDSENE